MQEEENVCKSYVNICAFVCLQLFNIIQYNTRLSTLHLLTQIYQFVTLHTIYLQFNKKQLSNSLEILVKTV